MLIGYVAAGLFGFVVGFLVAALFVFCYIDSVGR